MEQTADIRAAVTPLRLVFWGGLLWILDLKFWQTTNGEGFVFDVLNDTLATILITVGVFRLARFDTERRYASIMRFVKVVAVLSIVQTAQAHMIMERPAAFGMLLTALSLCQVAATVLFCVAMRTLCRQYALSRAAESWRITLILFMVIYAIPLGLFYAAALVALVSGQQFNINLGPAGLLLLPVFAAPIVHLFISTSRMRREAETARGAPVGAFPVVFPPEG